MDHYSSATTVVFQDVRSLLPYLDVVNASLIAEAKAISEWNALSKFCGRCGSKTKMIDGGAKRKCMAPEMPKTRALTNDSPRQQQLQHSSASTTRAKLPEVSTLYCGRTHYPRTDAVSITLAINVHGNHVLLGRKKEFPKGVYTCIAGFVEGGETIEEAARREIYEEAGIVVNAVEYFASQPWPMLGTSSQ